MSKESFGIGILSLTAAVLLVANYFASPPVASAMLVNQNRDFQVATARLQLGGDGLYILDNRTGTVSVFTYDQNTRRMVPRASRSLADAFGNGR